MKFINYIFFVISAMLSQALFAQNDSCFTATSFETLDINNVRAGLLNGGDLWHNGFHEPKYEVPRVNLGETPVHSLMTGAIWIGGYDQNGELRIAAQTHRIENKTDYWPGPAFLTFGSYGPPCTQWDRHWKVNKTEIDIQKQNYITYGENIPIGEIPKVILEWPASANPYATGLNEQPLIISPRYSAPFIDVNSDNVYNPLHGDHPDIKGDQAVYWIFNDIGNKHTKTGGKTLELQVQVLAYAFNTDDALNNTTFYNYTFSKKSWGILDSVYIGHWIDHDIGYYLDDHLGYIGNMNMGVGLNGDGIDGPAQVSYGSDPPAIGVKILKGPEENGVNLGLTRFVRYNNDWSNKGNPETPQHFYNYLSGTWKNGEIWKGPDSAYSFFRGVSLPDTLGYLCNETPFDMKYLMTTGPFSLNSLYTGDKKTLDIAVVWSRCEGMWGCAGNSFSPLQCLIDDANYVQQMFDNNFPLTVDRATQNLLKANIYPVPADDRIYITLPHTAIANIELLDLTGKYIRNYSYRGSQIELERDGLPAGIYFVKITTADDLSAVQKVIFK